MAEHLLGQRDPGRHQEGRPIDRVEAHHVLADQMADRPASSVANSLAVVGIADAGEVIGQRVEPDVHDVVRAARHLHAPVEAGARDRRGRESPPSTKRSTSLRRLVGLDEVGIGRIMVEQRLLIGGQAEEPALLDRPFDRRALRRELLAACRRRPAPSRRNKPRRGPNTSLRSGRDRGRPCPPSPARSPGWRGDGRARWCG